MIVYGDAQRVEETARLLAGLRADCARLAALPPGVQRRGAATRLLIDAGELTQGLLDAEHVRRGCDDWGPPEEWCAAVLREAARLEQATGPGVADGGPLLRALAGLEALPLPEAVSVKVPEGYAFYALNPELYARAARLLAAQPGPVLVLGLRSIGTSLAATVAVAADTPLPPLTLRPVGHPFQRTLQVGPGLERLILGQAPATRFAVVDEGPGLSGSSFGAVADWLEDHGTPPGRIHFLPGHGGDLGPRASPRHRQRWRQSPRHLVPFEELLLGREQWFVVDVANADLGLEDLSGGRWRAHLYRAEADWPPVNPFQERRKYLYRAHGRPWLARFAGLGRYGEDKWGRGRVLERAGLIPPPRDLRHGFLIGPWLSGARPLSPATLPDRGALLEMMARYLGLLAREFPAAAGAPGAGPAELLAMARHNTGEQLGAEATALLDPWREHLGALAGRTRRVCTDNRMHPWEWLLLPDGRLLKADALDHHQAHDCIGAQDLAWDVAGAAAEWDLSAAEQDELERRLARLSPYRPDPLVRRFCRLAYLSFQMGAAVLAAGSLADSWPAEAARLRAAAEGYTRRLRRELGLDGEALSPGG